MIVSRAARVPQVKFLLGLADALAVAGCLFLAILMRFGWATGLAYLGRHLAILGLICCSFSLTFYVLGLYENARLQRVRRIVSTAATSVAAATLVVAASLYATFTLPIGRGVILLFALLVFVTVSVVRLLYREAMHLGFLGQRCLVIGTGEVARRVIELVHEYSSTGCAIVGVVECSERRALSRLVQHRVLGTLADLDSLVEEHGVDRLILAGAPEDEAEILRRVRQFRYRGLALVDFVSLHEELAHEIPLDHIDDEWLFIAATSSSQFHVHRIKRVMDFTIALLLMIPVALVVLPIAALCIKLTSKGPVFFRQERLGLESRPFMLLKLRTMRDDAEKLTGPVWSSENDPRITAVGRILRKFRIDELPQLINVLRGDMSLIGPRPEREVFVRRLAQTLPHFQERLMVRPGITGWAQVMAPYAASVEDTRRKLQFDLYYIKNVSLFLDLVIVAKTVKTMLFGRERVQGGMATSAGDAVPLRPRVQVSSLAAPERKRAGLW